MRNIMALQSWVQLDLGQHVPGELFATWRQRLGFQRMNSPNDLSKVLSLEPKFEIGQCFK